MSSSQKTSNLELSWQESDWEPNTIVIEYSFLFPTVICMPRYDQLFRSYEFWKFTELLNLNSGQQWSDLGNLKY
jgi:hypothetical protein